MFAAHRKRALERHDRAARQRRGESVNRKRPTEYDGPDRFAGDHSIRVPRGVRLSVRNLLIPVPQAFRE